ncbi:DUF6185 family protein [Streptomyces canus]|uniref:DUF6185 family protein n=1 Tax=Streptomyces canus TaxID=58343 RepID=UPI0027D7A8BA|nr:DUF6185 family protein [Streptomyces canus]
MSATLLLAAMLGEAAQAADDECSPGQLKAARVTASVRLKHEGEDYTKADAVLTVKVPKSWRLAADLLLNGDTENYRTAMRCLLRDPRDAVFYRDTEGRARPPHVTVQKKWVTVEQHVTTWVVDLQQRDFGTWRLTEGKRWWTLELLRPPALDKAWWQAITVDLGGRAARSVSMPPTAGATDKLTWAREKAGGHPPELRVTLQPPATKASAARWSEDPGYVLDPLAWMPWTVAMLVLILAASRALRLAPVSSPRTEAEKDTVRHVRTMGVLTFVFTVVQYFDDALLSHFANDDVALFWTDRHRTAVHLTLALLTGLALCVFGRPQCAVTIRSRQLGVVVPLLAAAVGYVAAVVARPGWFGLPSHLWLDWENNPDEVVWFQQAQGKYAFVLACACVVLVWLVGATASFLRLWRSCGAPAPGSNRGRFPFAVLGGLVAVSVVIPAVGIWTAQNTWEQRSWLSPHYSDGYGLWHEAEVFNDLRWFPSGWLDWVNGTYFWWWGPSLAIVAALRVRAASSVPPALFPSAPEIRALKAFFIVCVAPVVGWYAGVPLSWLPLLALWGALTALLAVGRKRSVLYRELLPGVPLHEVAKGYSRQRLLKDARRHRELHAQLRRLEQGQEDGVRGQLEYELDRLNRLPNPSPPPGLPNSWVRLPHSVGPVELALAWGPRAQWWENACRAALFAALIAVPAGLVQFWVDHVRGSVWSDKFLDRFGFADAAMSLIAMEVIWAGAGFVLGALWRELPGRRGPTRAFWLSLVYAAPVLVHWVGIRFVDQPFGTWAFNLSLTLLVLTLTGVAMDIDTFRREAHYWPTKAGLLLSVYQWRTASIQVAFLVGQIVALVTIWQQMKGADPMILIERDPTEGASSGSGSGN